MFHINQVSSSFLEEKKNSSCEKLKHTEIYKQYFPENESIRCFLFVKNFCDGNKIRIHFLNKHDTEYFNLKLVARSDLKTY